MTTAPEDVLATWRECWSTPLHLAVVHGPDAGWVLPLDRRVSVGRHGADLAIADPALDLRHCLLEPVGPTVRVRDAGSLAGTRLLRAPATPRARRRRAAGVERRLGEAVLPPDAAAAVLERVTGRGTALGRRWRTLAVGDQLVLGSTRIEVRASPSQPATGPTAVAALAVAGGAPGAAADARGHRGRWLSILMLVPALAMLGVLLGGGHGSPTLRWVLLGGIALSVLLSLGGVLRGQRTERRRGAGAGASGAPGAAGPRDPAALAVCVAGLGRADERWAPAAAPPGRPSPTVLEGGTVLVTDDDAGRSPAALLALPEAGLAVTGAGALATAAWWRTQLDVRGRTGGTVLAAAGPEFLPPGPWVRVSAEGRCGVAPGWCAAVTAAVAPRPRPSLLVDLLGAPTARSVASAWGRPVADPWHLAVPLGQDPTGAVVELDLVTDGPHALVAGTTGSGKSELLASWVIAVALRHPPSRLHLLLVDYKGGSTFAAAARLPHTVGVLTDLDGAASDRALATLRAELQRREALVTAAGARGIADLADPPARLVVVVDELRALVEDSPDRLADLARIATQGRSLGIHLVLATQRPSGVVNAQLRANVNLRVCLRVLDAGDSTDVIGVADAAALPREPGGAVVETGSGLRRLQLAWLPGRGAEELVEIALEAAHRLRRSRQDALLRLHRPWLPELPSRVARGDLRDLAPASVAVGAHALALVDRPDLQRREVWTWDEGVLLVSGEPRSGRTTALEGVADACRAGGRGVHVVSRAGWGSSAHGTVVGSDDPRRVRRLLTLLAQGADRTSTLVIDDVEQVLDSLDTVGGPGSGQELLTALLRSGAVPALALAAAAPHRWAPFAAHHLALRVRDVGAAGMLGVPRAFVRAAAPPGRGVLLGGDQPLLVQVLVAGGEDASQGNGVLGPGGVVGPARVPREGLRLLPLPAHVSLEVCRAGASPGAGVLLGIGGDGALPVSADLEPGRPWLVCGAPGSGRTSVLDLVVSQEAGPRVRVTPETALTPEAVADIADGSLVVVDDADLLDPGQADALVALVPRCRVVVAASTAATATVYRGILAAVAQARTVLVLGGALPHHLAHARAAVDPRGPQGRAVLVTAREVTPVQLAAP